MLEIKTQRWITKKKEARVQNPATQASILTKPRRRKLQVMEIGSDVWFLTAAPVEERSNDAETQQPRHRFDQTQAAKASGDGNRIGRVVSRRHSSGGEEHVGEWVWFVYGFLGLGSGEWDNIWRKKERKNKKKIRVSLSDVLSGLGWIEIEFRGLSFHLN